MSTAKNIGPIALIIVTGLVVYSIIRGKKLNYLGQNWRHHLITPSMKALKMKSKMDREVKRALQH